MINPDEKARDFQKKSSAVTLSDMEMFVFPELVFSLVLANIMSPVIWRWRDDPWFADLWRKAPSARLSRLRQFIMEHYSFNLDLETWGLTTQENELSRFSSFIDRDDLAQSNALFGYEGDKYYYDIDIRSHFGLTKYTGNTIPYWKTETVEAMTAFKFREGYSGGAGECVSLSALYAAALFIILKVPLKDIFLMATPLHSQNFVAIGDGLICNNRRIVTKPMWFNGTEISGQARRALENERVTLVAHESGAIHMLYPNASINPIEYERFSKGIRSFLSAPLTGEILENFLRAHEKYQTCFDFKWEVNGSYKYIPLPRIYAYEHTSRFRISDSSRSKLLGEVDTSEFTCDPRKGAVVINNVEDFLKKNKIDLGINNDIEKFRALFDTQCLNVCEMLSHLRSFSHTDPRLPDASAKKFANQDTPLAITPEMTREEITARIKSIRDSNEFCRMAFYSARDLSLTEPGPFIAAAMQRNPVCISKAAVLSDSEVVAMYSDMPDESIYEGPERLAQPDEVANFRRGDGLERLLAIADILEARHHDPEMRIEVSGEVAKLFSGSGLIAQFHTSKTPLENLWYLGCPS